MIEEPNPSPVPLQPAKKSKKKLWIGIAIAIVVVAVVVSIVAVSMTVSYYSVPPPQYTPHFGFITQSTAEQITGINITQSQTISTTPEESNAIKAEVTFYNNTSGKSILIMVAQFSNTASADSFFNSEMKIFNSTHTTIINATYYTFNYSYTTVSLMSSFEGLAIGHCRDFVFLISDINIPISNFNVLIQAQINTMI
ncbi:MAG: hypothetical protein ACP5MB_10600 [bacterium]